MKKLTHILLLLALLLLVLAPTATYAQDEIACENDAVVQVSDWLSKLADKFYGDPLAYPAIVEATNAAAAADDSYATIDNPDIIEPGWKLCIPAVEATEALLGLEPATETSRTGVLSIAIQPIVQVDPAFISSDGEVAVANAVYDYLVDVDPSNVIRPRLAESWTVSDDGLTYVFSLVDNAAFHDGSPLTADDVVWTFDRLRDPESGLPTADLYANIDTIEATGDLEVTFTLTESNPFFLYDLSDNHALVLKADTADPNDFNGTGPFVVTNYSPEDRIELEANANYFVRGQPRLAGVEFIFFNDEAASIEALRSGQLDLAWRMSIPLYQSLQDEPGLVTVDIATNGFDVIRLRSDREPGNDPRVIQALKLATDREAIFQTAQQGLGAVGNDTPIGPLYSTYNDPDLAPPARDVEAAIALLAEAGYADGLALDLHTPDTGGRPDVAVLLKEQWAEAGVEVNVIVEPESVYYGDDGWLEVDLGITGWGSRPTPQFYMTQMLVTDAVWNESHFSDPELDELAQLAGSTLDEDERIQAYRDIQALLIERGPIIVPYFFAQVGAYSDQVQNLELKAFAGRTDLRTVTK